MLLLIISFVIDQVVLIVCFIVPLLLLLLLIVVISHVRILLRDIQPSVGVIFPNYIADFLHLISFT